MDAEAITGQLRATDPVLFTGAGFVAGASSVSGRPVPTTEQLCQLLWGIAFPGKQPDGSALEDVYECSVSVDAQRTADVLRGVLTVDEASLGDRFRTWFSVPWARVYTLNIDDLDEAVARRFALPHAITPVSSLGGSLPGRIKGLLSVHLNGRIADFPAITFSDLQYGQRTAQPDPWYQHLAVDLATRPVVFVGTSLAEPPLWQQLAAHLGSGNRPRSYIVTPHLGRARAEVLRRLNVEWVPTDADAFADDVLVRL